MDASVNMQISKSVVSAIPLLIDFPMRRFSVDYDEEADVLYISLQRPQKATNTVMSDDGILLRYRGRQLVGITILDASARTPVA
ncbi:MAG: DUF2283 domain-containing protein [Anaerolineae bacterium]